MTEAWQFWVEYGRKTGFGVRKQYSNKRKEDKSIRSCRFVCCKEGHRMPDKRSFMVKNPRAETITGCKERIALSAKNGKFVICDFVEGHNHCLQLQETTHMLASHRRISEVQAYEIEMAEDCGLMQKASFQLMSAHSGGRDNLGYTRLDARNYLNSKRQRSMEKLGSGKCYLISNVLIFCPWKDVESLTQVDYGMSSLEHPTNEFSQASENQLSYTKLLMDALSDE